MKIILVMAVAFVSIALDCFNTDNAAWVCAAKYAAAYASIHNDK